MNEIEIEIEIDETEGLYRPPTRTPFKMNRFVVAFSAVLGACWLGLASHSTRSATCAVCRMDRVDHALLGLNWADQTETECSQWYRDNVEPAHDHLWVRGGSCRGYGIPGLYWSVGCSRGSPVTYLSKSRQIEIYRHFANPLEAKQVFVHARWDDEEGFDRFGKLEFWAIRGFPGTWEEWLKTYEVKAEEPGPK